MELKDTVERCVLRRDHLLAVRARLMALNSLAVTSTANHSTSSSSTGNSTSAVDHHSAAAQRGVANGPTNVPVSQATPSSSSHRPGSAHVSPRNSAATISPIRVTDRSITSPRTQMHAPPPGSLPPPPAHSPRQLTSPRDRLMSSGHQVPPPPPSHHLPSPRSSPRGFPGGPPPNENGEYIPPVSVSRSVAPPPNHPHAHLLTVASTVANSRSGLPPPPPRQSASYSLPPSAAHHHMRQGPPPSHGGSMPHPSSRMMGGPPPHHGPPPPHHMSAHAFAHAGPGHYVMDRGLNRGSIHDKR